MATPAQILANQENSQKSSGPTSESGKANSSRNRRIHGLCSTYTQFFFIVGEDETQFRMLHLHLEREHKPQTETEHILVRRMAESDWLRARALRFQTLCHDKESGHVLLQKEFALYLRYQTTHERAFYKALTELQKLRNEKRNEQIGFESQKRASEVHEMKKQVFEWKKSRVSPPAKPETTPKDTAQPSPVPDRSPGNLEMGA
jgi:hypothetical protein